MYGGTKMEMERLLEDASKISGIKYDISSYADVVEAIHVMQTEMGIAGTTALEAEETISGSFNAMKAAATNLVAGFGNSNADISALAGELVATFETVVTNLMPVIQQIATAIPKAIGALLPAISSILPELLAGIPPLFKQVVDAIMDLLPTLIPIAVDAVFIIADTIVDNFPLLIDVALALVSALAEGLITALPVLVPKVIEIIKFIVLKIVENLPQILNAGLRIITALASGLIQSIPQLVKAVPRLIKALVASFNSFGNVIINIGKDIVRGIWEGIKSMGSWLADKAAGFFNGFIGSVKGLFGIKSPSRVMRDQVGKPITQGIAVGITAEQDKLNRAITDLSKKAIDVAMSQAKDFKEIGQLYAGFMGKGIEENTETSTFAVTKLVNDSIATLISKNKKAKGEYQKAGKEVISAYTTAIKDGVKEVQDQITAEVEKITAEAQAQYDTIIKKKEDMESKLAGFGELFTIDQESGEAVINNLNNQIDAIQRYDDVLSNLKSKGVSDEFMSEITKLGIGEGTKFGESLLKLSDEQFRAYEANWAEKQKLAKEVAAKFYKDQLDTLQSDMVNRLDTTLKSVPNIVKGVGVNAMQGMIDGMDSRKGAAVGKAKEIADAIIAELQRAMQINSPSRLTRDLIGKNIVRGIEVGIDDEKQSLLNKMKWVVDTSKNEMGLLMANKTQGSGATSVITNNNDNGVNQTVIVNSPVKSPLEMMREAKRVAKEMAYA